MPFHFSVFIYALQILLNPVTQDDDAMEGLGYISDLLVRCKVIEDTYLEIYTLTPSISGQRYFINFVKALWRLLETTKPGFALSPQGKGVF